MEFWTSFWLIMIIGSFLSFWGIAAVVAVRGIGDIRRLLAHMVAQHRSE